MEISWGGKPDGARTDIGRQIERRKAQFRKNLPQWIEQQRREAEAIANKEQ